MFADDQARRWEPVVRGDLLVGAPLRGKTRPRWTEMERAMAKEYELRMRLRDGFEMPPMRVQLDSIEDDAVLRQWVLDLAVEHDERSRSWPEEWIGEYTLRVYRPGTEDLERAFVAVR